MNPNCCHRADCADHNCPGKGMEPASAEAAFRYVLNVLAGIGFIAALISVVCFVGGWE